MAWVCYITIINKFAGCCIAKLFALERNTLSRVLDYYISFKDLSECSNEIITSNLVSFSFLRLRIFLFTP